MFINKQELKELKKQIGALQKEKIWFGPQLVQYMGVWVYRNSAEGWNISVKDQGINPIELLCRIANDLGYEYEPKKVKTEVTTAKITKKTARKVAKKKARKK